MFSINVVLKSRFLQLPFASCNWENNNLLLAFDWRYEVVFTSLTSPFHGSTPTTKEGWWPQSQSRQTFDKSSQWTPVMRRASLGLRSLVFDSGCNCNMILNSASVPAWFTPPFDPLRVGKYSKKSFLGQVYIIHI